MDGQILMPTAWSARKMAEGNESVRLVAMTHTLSIEPMTASPELRLRANALSVGRFVLHFGEMLLAMYVGMLIYMPLEGFIRVSLQGIGMALFMAWAMVVWMRIRGH